MNLSSSHHRAVVSRTVLICSVMDLGWLTLLAILDEYGPRPAKRGPVVRDDELSKRIKGMTMNGVAANGKGKGKAFRIEDSVSAR